MSISSSDTSIDVENVSKTFKLPHEKQTSIKGMLINGLRGQKQYEIQNALKDVSFKVNKGEFFGIVGRNGSGKSTLLKCIAGVYTPSKGTINVHGSLVPFIELGVGFNPELSGRDNVFLNGALLGFSRRRVRAIYDEIVEFAELKDFMDQKLKNYSSGMQVRLAFSIAIQAKSDILLLDEVLAVGDSAFQQKCFNYFEELKRNNKTVVLVTHAMDSVKRFCEKAILIENGAVKAYGRASDIADQYMLDNITSPNKGSNSLKNTSNKKLKSEVESFKITLISPMKLSRNESLEFIVEYILEKDLTIDIGYAIVFNGFRVAEQNTKGVELPSSCKSKHKVKFNIPLKDLNPGSYSLDVAMFKKSNSELVGYEIKAANFVLKGSDKTRGGPLKTEAAWKVI